MTQPQGSRTQSKEVIDIKSKQDDELTTIETFEVGTIDIDSATDRQLLRKIDMILMPLLCITYALQSIDKTTLSYAAVFGIRQDLHLTSLEFSWTGGIFYLGYLLFEYPANVLLQKFPVDRVLSAMVLCWGVVLMLHATTSNFQSLAAARTFLGVFECVIQPATMILFSLYYKREEQPLRLGIWIGCAGLGYVVAGIASFGIGHIKSSIASWRWTFLLWGIFTTVWGIALLLLLPGSPQHGSKLFRYEERRQIIERIKDNGTGLEDRKFKLYQVKEALLDAKTWLLFIFAVTSNAPNGGLTNFQGLIIKGLGFTTLQTTLISMPSGALQFVFCVSACFFASYFKNARLAIMLICLIPFLIGVIGQQLISLRHHYARLACIWICFSYTATWTLSMSVAMANTAGHTKKGVTAAMLIIGYSLGNLVGPFFFKVKQAPKYNLGIAMMFFCIAAQVVAISALWILMIFRNKKKQLATTPEESRTAQSNAFADMTGKENPFFRYVY